LSLSVATRNSAEPGNIIAAFPDRRGPSSFVMLEDAYEKLMRRAKAIATDRTRELIRRDILLDGETKQNKAERSLPSFWTGLNEEVE
jgi:hypothetical protein